jgi:hypothetical protein
MSSKSKIGYVHDLTDIDEESSTIYKWLCLNFVYVYIILVIVIGMSFYAWTVHKTKLENKEVYMKVNTETKNVIRQTIV